MQAYTLMTGSDFFRGFHEFAEPSWSPVAIELAREAWEVCADELLAKYIANFPTHRPWGWWMFSAPSPGRRERIDGGVHPFDNPRHREFIAEHMGSAGNPKNRTRGAYELHFGIPRWLLGPFFVQADQYETEAAYLERLELLEPDELKNAKAGRGRPDLIRDGRPRPGWDLPRQWGFPS